MQDVIKIKLKGLDCPHCAEKITADVKKIQEIGRASCRERV